MAESASSSFELDARLHVTAHEQGQTRQFPIGLPTADGIELVIGRSRSVDLTIHDDYISNRHLKIVFRAGEHWLEDLGSTHGTKVNDQPVKAPRMLKTGDVVSLGKSKIEYRCTRRPLEEVGSIADYAEVEADAGKTQPEQQTGVTQAQNATLNATKAAAAMKAADEAKAQEKGGAKPQAKEGAKAPAAEPAKPQAAAAPAQAPRQRPGFLLFAGAFIVVVGIVALVCYLAWQLFLAPKA